MKRCMLLFALFILTACEDSKREPHLVQCPIGGIVLATGSCIDLLAAERMSALLELDKLKKAATESKKEPSADIDADIGVGRLEFDFGFYCLRGKFDHQPEWIDDFRNKVNDVPDQNYASVEGIKAAFEEVDDYFKCRDVFRRLEKQNYKMESRNTDGKIIAEYTVDPKRIEQRKRAMALRAARVLLAAVSVDSVPSPDYFVIKACCDLQVSGRHGFVSMMVEMLAENGLKPSDVKRKLTIGHLVQYYKRGEEEFRARIRARAMEDLDIITDGSE